MQELWCRCIRDSGAVVQMCPWCGSSDAGASVMRELWCRCICDAGALVQMHPWCGSCGAGASVMRELWCRCIRDAGSLVQMCTFGAGLPTVSWTHFQHFLISIVTFCVPWINWMHIYKHKYFCHFFISLHQKCILYFNPLTFLCLLVLIYNNCSKLSSFKWRNEVSPVVTV